MAKGYLLGGLREFVPDESGRPLSNGKAVFSYTGGDEPAAVYKDRDCTIEWGTSVSIDSNGFIGNSENGVWLSTEHLYRVTIIRKVQEDPETWKQEWKVDDVGDIAETVVFNPDESVDTIAQLKALTPGSFESIKVNGWYSAGDCGEPMVFKWNSNAGNNEDGHWIKPSSSPAYGRWEQQLFDGFVDVRKFGAIPDSAVCDTAIENAMRWASEPRSYDSTDWRYRLPRTIGFVKSGNYKVASNVNFTLYCMASAYGSRQVPVLIQDGVRFQCENETQNPRMLTLSLATTVNSSTPIVEGNIWLDAENGSVVNLDWCKEHSTLTLTKCVLFIRADRAIQTNLTDCIVVNVNSSTINICNLTYSEGTETENGASVNVGNVFYKNQKLVTLYNNKVVYHKQINIGTINVTTITGCTEASIASLTSSNVTSTNGTFTSSLECRGESSVTDSSGEEGQPNRRIAFKCSNVKVYESAVGYNNLVLENEFDTEELEDGDIVMLRFKAGIRSDASAYIKFGNDKISFRKIKNGVLPFMYLNGFIPIGFVAEEE